MQDIPKPTETRPQSRRAFLSAAARSAAGLALVGAYPGWLWVQGRRRALSRRAAWSMGTSVSLTSLRDAESVDAMRGAWAWLARVEDGLSAHEPACGLSTLNRQPGEWMDADEDMLAVASASHALAGLTNGALDVTVLPVLRRLGFRPGMAPVAGTERIGFEHLRIDGSRVSLDVGGYGVDFGGIAKGYAVDLGASAAHSSGAGPVLLEAGGDLYGAGRPEPDSRWTIGVRDPIHVQGIAARFEIEDEAVATSGTYFQRRTVGGSSVSHLIDPRTGRPVERVLSSTVVARDCMTADALATATAVMEPGAAVALVRSLPDTEGLWIYPDRSFEVTPGLAARLEWT